MPQDSEEPNIGRVLGLLRRRGLWVLLCVVLAGAAAYGISKRQTKKYTATASLVFTNNELSQEIAGLSSASPSNLLLQQASNLELLHLGDMAARTAFILGGGLTQEKVEESLSITGQTESSIAGVSSTTTSPRLAAQIANTYARQFAKERRSANRQFFQSALELVHKQLAALTPEQRSGEDGLALQNRAQSLALLAELQPATVQVAQLATVPTQPSSPKTSRNTLIGCALGLLLGLALALLLERLDPRVRDSDELEAIYRLPLLGVVPQSSALARLTQKGEAGSLVLPYPEAEAFHMLRARLRSFNAGRDISVVLVSSAAPGEGKTTIACHLAGAAARMGSRVLLLEANLRHPTLASDLGIHTQVGLADVLSGAVSMGEVTRPIESHVASRAAPGSSALDLLPCGSSVPPNPVELLESRSMDILLERAKETYDLVVVDTTELVAVSDALLLLPKVDGVILVGYPGRSRRDVAERLKHTLDISHAPLVGLVANGSKSRAEHGSTRARGKEQASVATPAPPHEPSEPDVDGVVPSARSAS